MSRPLTIHCKVHLRHGRRSRKELCLGEAKSPPPPGRVPRISRLMALAIRFDQLIRDGVVTDQAELARLGHVTRARITQIMNLLNLAPDIQERILFLASATDRRAALYERHLRPLVTSVAWHEQRRMWKRLARRNQ